MEASADDCSNSVWKALGGDDVAGGESSTSSSSFFSSSSSSSSKTKRPKATFMCMIAAAIFESPEKRLSLQEIYQFVTHRFPYYNHTNRKAWQNAVRHNLSLHDCFVKIRRSACIVSGGQVYETTAHGGYWTLDAEAMEEFAKYGRIKRRPSARLVKMSRRSSSSGALSDGQKRRGRPPLSAATAVTSSQDKNDLTTTIESTEAELENDDIGASSSNNIDRELPSLLLPPFRQQDTSLESLPYENKNCHKQHQQVDVKEEDSRSSSSAVIRQWCDEVIRAYNEFP